MYGPLDLLGMVFQRRPPEKRAHPALHRPPDVYNRTLPNTRFTPAVPNLLIREADTGREVDRLTAHTAGYDRPKFSNPLLQYVRQYNGVTAAQAPPLDGVGLITLRSIATARPNSKVYSIRLFILVLSAVTFDAAQAMQRYFVDLSKFRCIVRMRFRCSL